MTSEKPIVGYLEVTVVARIAVHDLDDYEATTLADAVSNMVMWYNDGSADLMSDISFTTTDVSVVAVAADSTSSGSSITVT